MVVQGCVAVNCRSDLPDTKPLKVLLVASEAVPFAKVGGLADVTGALPKAIARLGHDVRVALPKYSAIDDERFGLRPLIAEVEAPMNSHRESAVIKAGETGSGVPVYFVENPRYFGREGIYAYADDGERFVFFCRAVMEMLRRLDWCPDVIHCHEWQTAIIPNWMKTVFANDPFFARTATVFTIHNLAFQGVFGYRVLEVAGIEAYGFLYRKIAEEMNVVDLMGRGILFADAVNTVSETYAREILTPEYGERLDPVLRERRSRLFGILNGIDYEDVDPSTDPNIASPFSLEHLERRRPNKAALQREVGLPEDPDAPLLGMISRLSDQKGLSIFMPIVEAVLRQGAQLVVLGTGEQRYHEQLASLARRYATARAVFTFNNPIARQVYAGSDMFLMPSRFEPCGLNQMIAMRYGSVPIVRRTGGLADTVVDFDPRRQDGSGFVFERYDSADLLVAIARALETYKHADTWTGLMRRIMALDHSWRSSAAKYVQLYRTALELKLKEAAVTA